MLRYHEGFALPYDVKTSGNSLRKGVIEHQDPDLMQIETSFNPYVLKEVLKFEYAKGVIQGAEISETMKRTYILIKLL